MAIEMIRASAVVLIFLLSACSAQLPRSTDYSQCEFKGWHIGCMKDKRAAINATLAEHKATGANTLLVGDDFEKFKLTKKYQEIIKAEAETSKYLECDLPVTCRAISYPGVSLQCPSRP